MPPSHLMRSCNLPLKLNSYCSASSMLPLHSLYLPICHFPVRQSALRFCMETVTPGEKVQQCIIRFCHSELCRAIGSWVNWIQMNALQVIWILTTAIHVIWIQAVQLKSGAKCESKSGWSRLLTHRWEVTHRDYRGIAHCWGWLASRPQFLPKPFLQFWQHVSLLVLVVGRAPWQGQVMDSLALPFERLHKANLLSPGLNTKGNIQNWFIPWTLWA